MRLSIVLSILALSSEVTRAHNFEPPNFDVVAALSNLGVNVSNLPLLLSKAKGTDADHCAAACSILSTLYGANALYTQETDAFSNFTSAYWSMQQSEVSPSCIFKPGSSTDVSIVVLLARLTQCPFAVKSGGHAGFKGASNIEKGITVSLERLNKIEISSDRKTVMIQPGNTWGTVYKKLDESDLTVPGGRVSRIGTGGLTLGGGISFFANLHGWGCDNVKSYEIVTASGAIIQASPESNPNLYWALRGGGNNFGIVTSFTFESIPLPGGKLWGGTKLYNETSFNRVADAFAKVVIDSPKDPNAGIWVSWGQVNGTKFASTELWYAKPNASKAAIFNGYNSITPILDTTQDRILHEYTAEIQESNPYGLRELFWAHTVKASPSLVRLAKDIFFEEYPAVANITGSLPTLIYQGITESQMRHMSKNGGNALGLDISKGPLYLVSIACWWEKQSDDDTIYSFSAKVMSRITAEAKKRGLASDYVYMNYASPFQNAIKSYGSANVAKLKQVAAFYDPAGVFQTLQPGYFKLDRAPVPDSGYTSD